MKEKLMKIIQETQEKNYPFMAVGSQHFAEKLTDALMESGLIKE